MDKMIVVFLLVVLLKVYFATKIEWNRKGVQEENNSEKASDHYEPSGCRLFMLANNLSDIVEAYVTLLWVSERVSNSWLS